MKFNLSIVPNALTVLNALSGIMAIIWLLQAEYTMMLWAFAVCLVADFLDGLVARLLGVSSVIGKDLDSLADAISFGTFPACLAYVMLTSSQYGDAWYLGLPGLLLAAAAIYRLARFNHSEEGSGPFTGLATPAMCISILGIFWNVIYGRTMLAGYLESYWVLLIAVLLFAWLCISSIPLISNKILGRGVVHILPPVLASLALIIPLLIFGIAGLAVFVPLYVIISLVYFGLIKSD